MASERQLAANRANAGKSTGPRTKRGRQASSRNAWRHGLSAVQPQPAEDWQVEVEALTAALLDQRQAREAKQEAPARRDGVTGELQRLAARRAAQAHLDLLQVRRVRASILASLDIDALATFDLHRLSALDRYERIARGRRRMAAAKLTSGDGSRQSAIWKGA